MHFLVLLVLGRTQIIMQLLKKQNLSPVFVPEFLRLVDESNLEFFYSTEDFSFKDVLSLMSADDAPIITST